MRTPPAIVASLLLVLNCGGDDTPTGPSEPLLVTTASLPNARPSFGYSQTLAATGGGGGYTWSVAVGSLPSGLNLAASTGIISGVATGSSSAFTVQVASGDGKTAQGALAITVRAQLVLQPSELCSGNSDYDIATFEDPNLESAVRGRFFIGTQADITCDLIARPLGFFSAGDAGIGSLVGFQNITALTAISLSFNSISDISALSELTTVTGVTLNNNSITDISALSGLTGLTTHLYLDNNSITDINALSGLINLRALRLHKNSITDVSALSGLTTVLTNLTLYQNSITDISVLSGLTGLTTLDLQSNISISDLSPLSGLTSLEDLQLFNNPDLSDIQPLLDNTGLGTGDVISLNSTNVSCTDVAALEEKGVSVLSSCP